MNAAARTEAMLDRLKTYVDYESPTAHPIELDALGEVLLARHRELGARVRREPSYTGDHLVMDHPGTGSKAAGAPVLCLCHHDTVWPVGQIETIMPWRVHDGLAFGPGVFDMKSGLVVLETALEMSLETEHPPVRVVVVADEEVGSPTSTDLVTRCADGVAAVLGFESPHSGGELKIGRRGSTRLRMNVRGIEAHAALDPGSGVSAIDELIDQLTRVRSLGADASGEVLCNVGTIEGGGRTNVVAAEAWADVGLRFGDAESEQVVLDGLRSLRPVRGGAGVSVRVLSRRPTWEPGPASSDLLVTIASAARQVGQSVSGQPAAGAADTNTTGSMGIATVDGFGPRGAGAHAVHEQVVVSSLPERAELVTAILGAL